MRPESERCHLFLPAGGRLLIALAVALALIPNAEAAARLPAIFGSHMVLQQNREVLVWGWADPGKKVSVTIAGHNASAAADSRGHVDGRSRSAICSIRPDCRPCRSGPTHGHCAGSRSRPT
jgi:hypothetical protein